MGLAKNKFNYLRNVGTWGAKSLEDDKIVAMAAAINELKGQLKLAPQLGAAAAKGDKDKDKDKRGKRGQKGKNKKTDTTGPSRRRMKRGKRSRPRMARRRKRQTMDVPTTGASTTWLGPCIAPKNAALEGSKKGKTRSPSLRLWRPPRPPRSTPRMRPFSPPLPGCRTRRNNGSSQCGRGHLTC
jgi:hypothetical protein